MLRMLLSIALVALAVLGLVFLFSPDRAHEVRDDLDNWRNDLPGVSVTTFERPDQ